MRRNKRADKKKVIAELEKTPIATIACQRAGVPRPTYYRWLSEDPDFAFECDQARQTGNSTVNDMTEYKLFTKVNEGNMTAIKFRLQMRHPDYKRGDDESRGGRSRNPGPKSVDFTPEELEAIFAQGDQIVEALNNESASEQPQGPITS